MTVVSSWGRLSRLEHKVVPLVNSAVVPSILMDTQPGIAFGNGRSYGDSCLNPNGILWPTRAMDHLLEFDAETGLLKCEAGVLLREIQHLFVPRGWMLAVTPGTQLITVGGAIANDVHGKNHHVFGTFGDSVRYIKLIRSNGEVIQCSPELHEEWFSATVGGLGLTGVIVEVWIQLRRVAGAWLDTESIPYQNIDEFLTLADQSEANWEHTVSWIDCVGARAGRGIFMRGNHSMSAVNNEVFVKTVKRMPLEPPISLVNNLSVRAFNELYFRLNKLKAGHKIVHFEEFFYPLDGLLEWNKMYGPKGFFQYQCVIPRDVGNLALQEILREIGSSGEGSFLAVLKTFSKRRSVGMLSFPMPGITLALDFPNRGARTEALFQRLDAIVGEAEGRIYMAKDARMGKELFESGYPNFSKFLNFRDYGMSSAMSRRLFGN